MGVKITEFLSYQPPSCQVNIYGGDKYTNDPRIFIEVEADGENRIRWISISNDNETWSDWELYFPVLNWVLDNSIPGTRSGEGDGYKTVYVKVKDAAGLESEVASTRIYLFMDDPDLGQIPSVEDGKQSLNKPLRITFNGPMNKTSVEEAFSIDPPIEGNITWDDMTLIFTPTNGWVEGQSYTVTVGKEALDVFGRNLTEDIEITFTVVDEDIGDDDDDIVDDDVDDDDVLPPDDDDDTSGKGGAFIAVIVILVVLILIAVAAVIVFLKVRGKKEEEEGWGGEE
jgi:hypothetical protein